VTPPGEKRVRALLLSLVVAPGAGQLAQGRRARGALMLAPALGLTCALLGFVVCWTWIELVYNVPARSRKKYIPPSRISGRSEPRNTRRSKPESTPVMSAA
jgi:hypothetical protein